MMITPTSPLWIFPTSIILLVSQLATYSTSSTFHHDFYVTWSPDHVNILDNGQQLQLKLDNFSGSAIASIDKFLFGSINMQMKLVPGNSAGTVTTYYLSSETSNHDELDFEFLGNLSGDPYILQTNVFSSGVGGREQRIYLWFDPTADFHSYSFLWNPHLIVFSVDGIPIRVFPNNEALGVPYLNGQGMGVYSSIWNGDNWATRGGLVKVDWVQAPFVASYTNYTLDVCEWTGSTFTSCADGKWWNDESYQALSTEQAGKVEWVEQNYMIYNYCTDEERYPEAPVECNHQF